MPAQPNNWNIIISGAWNRAILTPDGIRKRLFNLPEGTPIQLEVAVDRPGSFRAINTDGVIVVPSSRQLELAVQTNDLVSLKKAGCLGQEALRALPETPVAAVGVNIRYELESLPDELLDLLKTPIDDAYSDGGFTIASSTMLRSLKQSPGVVNVEISQSNDGKGAVVMNFHRESNLPNELCEWLDGLDEFFAVAKKLMMIMKIPVEIEEQQ